MVIVMFLDIDNMMWVIFFTGDIENTANNTVNVPNIIIWCINEMNGEKNGLEECGINLHVCQLEEAKQGKDIFSCLQVLILF